VFFLAILPTGLMDDITLSFYGKLFSKVSVVKKENSFVNKPVFQSSRCRIFVSSFRLLFLSCTFAEIEIENYFS